MRAMFLIMGSVLLCVGLFGCDRAPQTAQAPVVAATPPCNCIPPAPPAPVPVTTAQRSHRHHRHHRHTVAEMESAAYEAERESGSYETMAQESSGYGSEHYGPPPPPPAAEPPVWVDGYGRAHYATSAEVDENPARLSAEDRHARRSVWHGYDSDCAE